MFYVYEWYDVETNLVIYAGIKHRKPFYIGDTLFNTLNEAALKFDVTPQAIVYGLKHGSFKGLPCYRKSK